MSTVKEIFEQGSFSTTLEGGIHRLLQLAKGLMEDKDNMEGDIVPILVMQKNGIHCKIGLLGTRNERKKILKKSVKAFRPEAVFFVLNSNNRVTDGRNGPIVEMYDALVCMAQTAHSSLVAMQPYVKNNGSFAWDGVDIYRDSDHVITGYGKLQSSDFQQTTTITEY